MADMNNDKKSTDDEDKKLDNEQSENIVEAPVDESAKRKRDDEENALAENKKTKAESIISDLMASRTTAPDTNSSSSEGNPEMMEVPQDKVGQIIGSRGAIIQEMQTRSGCKIFVNQDFPPGVNRQVTFSGTPQQIKAGRELVRLIVTEGPTAIHMLDGPIIEQEMECPHTLVGRIIGASGGTIKELQSRCGAKIQINQNFPEGVPRKILITGNNESVQYAMQLINFVMDNGPSLHNLPLKPGSAPPMGSQSGGFYDGSGGGQGGAAGVISVTQLPNGAQQQILEIAKTFVGRIIGRSGETINLIQNKSGAKVQIDQSVPEGTPCKINISGNPQCVHIAVQMIQELIINGPQRLPMMNGMQQHQHGPMGGGGGGGGYYDRGGMGGGGFGGGMGGGGMPMGQQFGFNAGYGQGAMGGGFMGPGMGYGGGGGMMGGPQGYGGGGMQASAYGPSAMSQQQQWPQQHHQQQQQQQQQQSYAQVAPAKSTSLPAGWTEHKTDDGTPYWYNSSTGVSQWERPV